MSGGYWRLGETKIRENNNYKLHDYQIKSDPTTNNRTSNIYVTLAETKDDNDNKMVVASNCSEAKKKLKQR